MTDRQMAPETRVLNPPRRAVERMLDFDAAKTPARLLFATSSERPSADAVQHARDFAQAVGAEMHVLYLASEPSRLTLLELEGVDARPTLPEGPAIVHAQAVLVPEPAAKAEASSATNATLDTNVTYDSQVTQVTRAAPIGATAASVVTASSAVAATAEPSVTSFTPAWCDDIFPEELRSTRVAVRTGDFTSTVCEHAEAIGASLIIVSGHERPGGRVTALARAAAVPVLVARARAAEETTILAATDLSDEQYPILRLAYKLGGLTRAPLVAVHNVAPKSTQLSVRARGQANSIAAPDPAVVTKRLEILVDVTRNLGFETAVLSSMLDPVDAVLREAKARHVDTIVVGTRAPAPGERASVAAQVINLATQSVLVIPLELTEPSNARSHTSTQKLFAIESNA